MEHSDSCDSDSVEFMTLHATPFFFLLTHKRSYDAASDSYSIASESQP